MNVADLFQAQAEARPDAVALVEGRGRRRRAVTFADLERLGAEGAGRLAHAGLAKGDAVLVLVPLSVELYVVLAAVLRLGLVAVLLDPGAGRAHVAACCRVLPPAAFVGVPKAHGLRLFVPGVRRIPLRFAVGGWVPGAKRWSRGGGACPVTPCAPDDPALLTFTTGSTGAPKAAVRTHGFLRAQHRALAEALGHEAGQVDLPTLPVFVLAGLASGLTSVLPEADLRRPGAVAPAPVLAQIEAEEVTRSAASPAFFERLLGAEDLAPLARLRRLDTGGAPVFPDLLDRLQAAAPAAEVVAVYGSTEAEPIAELPAASLTASDRERVRTGSGLPAGRPVDTVRLRVIEDCWGTPIGPLSGTTFEALTCPPGTAGEIVVSGAHVLPGYLGGAGDAESKFEVGGVRWHRTGDAGTLETDGRLWLLGRCAAAVRDAHGTLYPLAVEAAAREVAGVRRSALVAAEGRRTLVVEAQDGFDDERLREALAWAHLAAVLPVAAVPLDRRHNAKVDYPALQVLLNRSG
ncbi:MAG: AMP-binding protein [Bacteroidota bacterium]